MDVVFVVVVVSKGIVARHCSTRLAILCLGIVLALSLNTCGGLHTDILVQELFRGEFVDEVLRGDEAALLVGVFEQDLVQALDDCLHNLLEAETHRLFFLVVGSDVLTELLVNLLDNAAEPFSHVRVSQVHFLAHLDSLVVELLSGLDLDGELVDLWVGRASTLDLEVGMWVRVLHLQLVQLLCHLFVLVAKSIQLLLVIAHILQILVVRRLTSVEFLNDLLDVRFASLGTNVLESLLNLGRAVHFFFHLALEEGAPKLLGQ